MINRRDLLRHVGLGATAAMLPGLSFARADTDARLVLVILRGAVDGLALVAPYGEGRYQTLRGELAMASPDSGDGVLKLDGLFGLHPAMQGTYELFQQNQALLLHAVASPYRERSHFDGQDVLENGASAAGMRRDGWLNRALEPLGGGIGNEVAIAMSQNTPLVLRGENSVTSWAPSQLKDVDSDTLRRIEELYADDEFFLLRLTQALESQQIAGDMGGMERQRRASQGTQFRLAMQSAGKFLTAAGGPQIAVVEAGGWDTHANQGADRGSLASKFSDLDAGLSELRSVLGDRWRDTVIAVVTEFGRTVQVNGTRGTDHGTATAAVLAGGAIQGGRVVADWPGLGNSELYQGRDLFPTTDIRSVFKGILSAHLHLSDAHLDGVVFPDSGSCPALEGLIRG